ncbi:hypothetical protein PTTG_25150 [Puccinia triticina 1-1 BBBD Race 1]|uniref:Uncharacterized protein n=1 Tax=Puccinia triticina (isolate 1-1 / race 1 (BBBD)) TaxID=630390 RepID=A0A180H5I9_PUCT1|nr:hypothetical protein PTTG_25150 [Puccinia triticina 1-1 BBBD Race 1]
MENTVNPHNPRESRQRYQRTHEIEALATLIDGWLEKYSLEPEHVLPANNDRSLKIEDMAGKAEILEKLESDLLPSIKNHLTSLLTSLELIIPRGMTEPNVGPTQLILTDLDRVIESTLSCTAALTLQSPLPDEEHDYGLQNLKIFRSSHLQKQIKILVGSVIARGLFIHLLLFLQFCAVATIIWEDAPIWRKGMFVRDKVHSVIADALKTIDITIDWYRQSDWDMVQGAWNLASGSSDTVLQELAGLTTPAIQSAPEADPNDNTNINARNDVSRDSLVQLQAANAAMPLVKLARILAKKTSESIAKKRRAGALDVELNSVTMKELNEATELIYMSLEDLSSLLPLLTRTAEAMRIHRQNEIRSLIADLREAMGTTLTPGKNNDHLQVIIVFSWCDHSGISSRPLHGQNPRRFERITLGDLVSDLETILGEG